MVPLLLCSLGPTTENGLQNFCTTKQLYSQTEMKTFDFLNDYEDWRDFVYKIKLRLNQVEERPDVHGRSFSPLQSVAETDSKADRPVLLRKISNRYFL